MSAVQPSFSSECDKKQQEKKNVYGKVRFNLKHSSIHFKLNISNSENGKDNVKVSGLQHSVEIVSYIFRCFVTR